MRFHRPGFCLGTVQGIIYSIASTTDHRPPPTKSFAFQVDLVKQAKKEESDLVKSDIWFKFKEGYSNAVRRNVKMKDLL